MQKAHLELKVAMHPAAASCQTFEEQSRAEVGVIERLFPGNLADSVRVCFVAWLAFVCTMDDILECLSPSDGEAVLYRCIGMLRNNHKTNTNGKNPKEQARWVHDWTPY